MHSFQTIKDIVLNFGNTNGKLERRLCQNCTSVSFIHSENSAGATRLDIVMNNLASPRTVIEIDLNFFRFLVLELFECRRGDLHKTATRKFVRSAHS